MAWINAVKPASIQSILQAVTNFQEESLREAWSWYMALTAGVHLWPDANHRTGMVTFGIAADEALGLDVALNPQDAEEMVLRSKEWRNARHSPITAHELRIVDHPYRQVFRDFEARLDIGPVE